MENRMWRLKSRPTGLVTRDNFTWSSESLPSLRDGEVLVASRYISLDPTHRIWMTDMDQYMPPIAIGEVIRSIGLAEVVESRDPSLKSGDWVRAMTGWQEYSIHPANQLEKLPIWDIPKSTFLSVLGLTGLTAYFGLIEVTSPKSGETLVVSGAAGAVGTIVGQIGKILGLKVIGIAGSDSKVEELTKTFKFDAAVNYKSPTFHEDLKRVTPEGVDIYFDNVGGTVSDAVWTRMNLHGRISQCGLISAYNSTKPVPGPANFAAVIMKRLSIKGFILFDYHKHYPKALAELHSWIKAGKITYRDDITSGLEHAPEALNKLFTGANTGKLMIQV